VNLVILKINYFINNFSNGICMIVFVWYNVID